MKKLPDIFNDVIGPVMRGPSSSHTAASWRIGRMSISILNDEPEEVLVEFDRNGAWAPNYREQGTCMGIEGGLLELDITDAKMKDTHNVAQKRGIIIDYRVSSYPTDHANTVRLTLTGKTGKSVQVIAVSTGGGAFEIRSINGFRISLRGDAYEILAFTTPKNADGARVCLSEFTEIEFSTQEKKGVHMYHCISHQAYSAELVSRLKGQAEFEDFAIVSPVLPIISAPQTLLPFDTIKSLQKYAEKTDSDLGDLGLLYEKSLSGLAEQELKDKMSQLVQIVHNSIDTGLSGTAFDDRILHQQSHLIAEAEKQGRLKASVENKLICYVTALMESKSAMEVIVAFPTAGSCGTVGGALRAIAEDIDVDKNELIKAYFAAGLVGAYFAMGPGFSAEEHGCQVECGAASGMAAAAIVQLLGGTARQAIAAASMAIQNMIGMVCDPVADRVEVPCLGKNISAAVNARASAVMAIAGFDAVIPLDEVIETVSRVSKTMPSCVKCTGKGGLAITQTALNLKRGF